MSAASSTLGVAKSVRTRSERSLYSGSGSSEIGRPAAMRRPANDGISVQCSRPRSIGSIWTIASSGVFARSQRNASCCAGVTTIVQRNSEAWRWFEMSCAFQVSTSVVGRPIARIAAASSAAANRFHSREHAGQQDRDRDEQDLTGAEPDP